MRGWLILLMAWLALAVACGGPRERAHQTGEGGPDIKPLARELQEPAYHWPVGRWRAEHGGLVDMSGRASGAGFELGECLLCHRVRSCNACHAYTGAPRLPREDWQ